MQVARWGNSLAIRLPAAVVEALELKEGDQIDDALIAASALLAGYRRLFSEDLQDGQILEGRLTIINPF